MDVVILGHEAARAQLGGVDRAAVEHHGARDANAPALRPDGLLSRQHVEERALRRRQERKCVRRVCRLGIGGME